MNPFRIKCMQKSKGSGGARVGAGRPESADEHKKQNHTIRTTNSQWETFLNQGGNKWLCQLLESIGKKAKS